MDQRGWSLCRRASRRQIWNLKSMVQGTTVVSPVFGIMSFVSLNSHIHALCCGESTNSLFHWAVLYVKSSHYHHCANLSEDIELPEMPVRYILSSVWIRLSIFSQLSIIQYMGLCVFSLPISLAMIERIYTLSYHHHQIGSMTYYPLFRVRSWNNGMRCMSLYILMETLCSS